MVTVSIGQAQMQMDNVDEGWINRQLNGRRADGRSVCVTVRVRTDAIDVSLSTLQCLGSGGGGRQANPREQRILDEWARHRLNTMEYTGGQLIAFLRAVWRLA